MTVCDSGRSHPAVIQKCKSQPKASAQQHADPRTVRGSPRAYSSQCRDPGAHLLRHGLPVRVQAQQGQHHDQHQAGGYHPSSRQGAQPPQLNEEQRQQAGGGQGGGQVRGGQRAQACGGQRSDRGSRGLWLACSRHSPQHPRALESHHAAGPGAASGGTQLGATGDGCLALPPSPGHALSAPAAGSSSSSCCQATMSSMIVAPNSSRLQNRKTARMPPCPAAARPNSGNVLRLPGGMRSKAAQMSCGSERAQGAVMGSRWVGLA